MKTWVFFAVLSMFFAGLTAVIAKMGLAGISSELGIVVRTAFVFIFVLVFGALSVSSTEFAKLTASNGLWLGLSGLTTAFSWVFYYKALKEGDVPTVALIDKGSVVVAILLAWIILKEELTFRTLAGASLMISGLLVIARK